MIRTLAFAMVLVSGLGGCAGPVERWIVNTRVRQGDAALARGSLHEAELSYGLALKVSPHNARARAGFAHVSEDIAETDYESGNLQDAIATLEAAAKYDPGSVRLQAMRQTFEDARLKREIVVSNYPTYTAAGTQIGLEYRSLTAQNTMILHLLKRFGYSYDTNDLTKAIQDSYELQLDVAKNTNRLIAFRQLVESGVPAVEKGSAPAGATGSLLPLP
ncbi:MAG: tetratricopeptide repeat protein [Candidatus Eremiobacteraeota bacterium]|nr:tetratricopeptide repeat protein [Candidatus Eremiobacteraeota bacterium]